MAHHSSASAGSQAKIDIPRVRRVGLLVERPVHDHHALPPRLGTVGEVARPERVELTVRHLPGIAPLLIGQLPDPDR